MSPDAAHGAQRPGCFVAVVGPSGAGKDTLLQLAAAALQPDPSIRFARRIVTRAAHVAIEDHDEMSPAAFDAAEREGGFCLSWRAHDLGYGLPARLNDDLAAGRTVVANVSRRVLAVAATRFAHLAIVEITAPRALLLERLAVRGREAAADIEARLSRRVELVVPDAAKAHHRIVNDASADAGAAALCAFIRQAAKLS